VSHLKQATPATVSRGGVLFINETDIGWRPFWDAWIHRFKGADEKENAYTTFSLNLSTYCDDTFTEDIKKRSTIAPMCLMAYVQSLCAIIDFLYDELKSHKQFYDHFKKLREGDAEHLGKYANVIQNPTYDDVMKLVYEGIFAYAMIWSFGAALQDSSDRSWFNGTIRNKAGKIKFPEIQNSQVYDFKFDVMTATWVQWSEGM